MHLVDAIRLAAQKGKAEAQKEPTEPQPAIEAEQKMEIPEVPQKTAKAKATPAAIPGASDVYDPIPVNPAVTAGGGSVVRLELFLTPEQMNQMLRGILNGAHTVMTLREAAQYLRISNDALTKMAESGEVVAFMVEGRWKFPRHSIDEWMTLQTLQSRTNASEEDEDVA